MKHDINVADWCVEEDHSSFRKLIEAAVERTPKLLFPHLETALKEARSRLFAVQEAWDDEAAPQVNPEAWKRAEVFLRNTTAEVFQMAGIFVPIPTLAPGAEEGSIDLLWRENTFELLINIPPEGEGDFYGTTASGLEIKGKFRPELHHKGILSWLVNNG